MTWRSRIFFGLIVGCGSGDSAAATVRSPAGDAAIDDGALKPDGAVPKLDGALPVAGDGGPMASAQDAASDSDGSTSGLPGCDLSGIWIGRQNTESRALDVPQYANNWYYFELSQRGSALTVSRHMDCGIEVRGTVLVNLAKATTLGLSKHNSQVGRRGSVGVESGGTCSLAMEHFWSVRGVSESAYVPNPRNMPVTIAAIAKSLPLPTASQTSLAEDWDDDGRPGVRWQVSGIVSGVRHSAQRDWTRYFSAPGYSIPVGNDFPRDVVLRAEFGNEEVIFDADLGLNQLSQPNAGAAHTVTLRFLGRTLDDARAKAVRVGDDYQTCLNIQAALPSVEGLK